MRHMLGTLWMLYTIEYFLSLITAGRGRCPMKEHAKNIDIVAIVEYLL